MMKQKELQEYAREHGIRFDQVLGWYMTGLIMLLTDETGFAKNLALVRPVSLDPTQDRHRLEDGILCYYLSDERITRQEGFVPGCPYTQDFRERLLFKIQERATRDGYPLDIRVISKDRKVELHYDDMYVPLNMRIRCAKVVYPEQKTLTFFDPEIPQINAYVYPPEDLAAEYITRIFEKLELISDMEVYLYLYELLGSETMAGRDICEKIKALHPDGWKPSENCYEIFSTYDKNSYMKKKWKVLLRRHRLKEPAWEDVMGVLKRFVEPLWNSLTTDVIFFADWMPDLGRFLD